MTARFTNPKPQFATDSGKLVPGGRLFFYENGTTTLKLTWANAALSVLNPDPIILDASGRIPDIFANDSDVFSVELKDANDVGIWGPIDNISFNSAFSLSSEDVLSALEANSASVVISGASMSGSAYLSFASAFNLSEAGSINATLGTINLGTVTGQTTFSSALTIDTGGLTVAAGAVNITSGDLIMGTASPEINFGDGTDTNTNLDIDARDSITTAKAQIRFHRSTNTSGEVITQWHPGDGSSTIRMVHDGATGDLTMNAGDLTVSAGNVLVTAGNVQLKNDNGGIRIENAGGASRIVLDMLGTDILQVGNSNHASTYVGSAHTFSSGDLTVSAGTISSVNASSNVQLTPGSVSGLSANNQARIASSSINGAYLFGQGSTSDVSIANLNGNVVISIPTGTSNVDMAGDLDISGAITLGTPTINSGSGTPEGSLTAPIGSTFHRTDGSTGTSFYVKESGAGNTGWISK